MSAHEMIALVDSLTPRDLVWPALAIGAWIVLRVWLGSLRRIA